MNRKTLSLMAAALLGATLLAGCAGTDVVAKYAPNSLEAILTADPALVRDNTAVDHYYYLSVDGSATLRVSDDFSMTGTEDLVLETALKPFTDAGLDVSKLGDGYRVDGGKLLLTADFGNGTGKKDNVRDSLFEAVKADRNVLGYHTALDHYGIKLPRGKFEWAKDYKTNSKDIVFVIAAQPLADLGVNVQNVAGWTFATLQDEKGNNVDLLLKPYNLP